MNAVFSLIEVNHQLSGEDNHHSWLRCSLYEDQLKVEDFRPFSYQSQQENSMGLYFL